ncbi:MULTISPECIES: PhzF family phenazine biosynthesis protein [Rhodococcus]|uniref:PhzF family phenazine biosynthesis protein n=1 Tax=Rhodococcus TaxID=1827 RepID=UPI001BDF0959|nr:MULTISPECIES: PhzF family phenazine biosynthesis protein [Rhodococcus]MBX9148962.1 PhzF family phenazine biosynthesis protein [Rhodococcus qingshengii]MDF3319317.1 PhzF family phenazine biosynthesis protein [Rhodococcus sp. C3V]
MGIEVSVVRVFTDEYGKHGNPLGIVDASTVAESDRQAVAKELDYSETIFIDVPDDGASRARVQIFTPAAELPFAGHPTVGATWWLGEQGRRVSALDVPAGSVDVRQSGALTWVRARAEWAPEFAIYPMDTVDDVIDADPSDYEADHSYLWAWQDKLEAAIRARMFAPVMGIAEDEATGSAALRITDRLRKSLLITQGRGSVLHTTFSPEGWLEVGGRVVAEPSRTL